MRVWLGKEMEGPDKGLTTLFIEEQIIRKQEAFKVYQLLNGEYGTEVRQLYLGAGRKDINLEFTTSLEKLISEIGRDFPKVRIVLETSNLKELVSYTSLVQALVSYGVRIVYRNELEQKPALIKQLLDNTFIKVDDMRKTVYIDSFRGEYKTNIDTVEKGLYKNEDVMIYEEENK